MPNKVVATRVAQLEQLGKQEIDLLLLFLHKLADSTVFLSVNGVKVGLRVIDRVSPRGGGPGSPGLLPVVAEVVYEFEQVFGFFFFGVF